MITPRAREFWRRMAERFGQRWYDERGTQPNDEWCALLAGYSDTVVGQFFSTMPPYQHPPTHPMVAHELGTILRKGADDKTDHVRSYWRSSVNADLECMGALLGLWPRGMRLQSVLPLEIRTSVLRFAGSLVDELVTSERQIGYRNHAMIEHCSAACWDYAKRLQAQHASPVLAKAAAS